MDWGEDHRYTKEEEDKYFLTKTISMYEYKRLLGMEKAFAAQSRKLQSVLHIPGVKETIRELDWRDSAATY